MIVMKPEHVTYDDAAALFSEGQRPCIFRKANIRQGHKVLIYGASGAVGNLAVQLAKHAGAVVTGVCSTVNVELVKSLGTDQVVDYTQEDISTSGERYDIILMRSATAEIPLQAFACRGREFCHGRRAGVAKVLMEDLRLLTDSLGSIEGMHWNKWPRHIDTRIQGVRGAALSLRWGMIVEERKFVFTLSMSMTADE